MKFPVLIIPFLRVSGMALFPFILIKYRESIDNKTLMNHESIHLKQQLELLIIPFYMLYLFNYFVNLLIFQNHEKAYRLISFEKEAYLHENDLNYLKRRRIWSWLKYVRKSS